MTEPRAGPLEAGVATIVVDVPVGAPTGGYSRHHGDDDPGSRWAQNFPSTTGVHTDATARALVFTNGLTRTALVRLDVCLVTPSLRARIRSKLDAANEPSRFVVQGTHTHGHVARFFQPVHLASPSGPDFVAFGMDVYDAELEDRIATAAAESIVAAFASMKKVSLGIASVEAGQLNADRRCENDPVYGPDFRDTALTLARFDEVDGSGLPVKPFAALMHFAVHGTVLSGSNTLLTTDAPGAMELAASDALGVPVVYAQGPAGDVSPAGSALGFDGTQRLEWMGRVTARLVRAAFERAQPLPAAESVTVLHVDRGVLLSRDALGYQKGEFPEHGGIGCQEGGKGCGLVVTPPDQGGLLCAPVEPRPRLRSTMSLVQLGGLAFLTLPGEPSTAVGRKVAERLTPLDVGTRLTFGYAQDHYGYLLEQDDFLRGGYEPTVSPWGWRTGQYLADEAQRLVETRAQAQEAPSPVSPPDVSPRELEASEGAPVIVSDVAELERGQAATFVFTGGEPGLGTPSVAVEREVQGAFEPVMASPTRAMVNGPEVIRRYRATPTVAREPMATTRRHEWTARWELPPEFPLGRYRLVATGRAKVNGEVVRYRLESTVVSVTRSSAIFSMFARRTSDGKVALAVRYRPNPMRFVAGDPVANFRLWDESSRADVGLTAVGETLPLELSQGTTTLPSVTASWSATEAAFVFTPTTSGPLQLRVEAEAFVDALGNTNGAPMLAMVAP